jgi:hypothetical protein
VLLIDNTLRAPLAQALEASGFTGDFQRLWQFDGRRREGRVGLGVSFVTHPEPGSASNFFLEPAWNALLCEAARARATWAPTLQGPIARASWS